MSELQLVAFVIGFVLQDLRVTMGIYATGFLTTLLVRTHDSYDLNGR